MPPTRDAPLILQGSFTNQRAAIASVLPSQGSRGPSSTRLPWAPAELVRDPGSGRGLDPQTRSEMEQLYGAPFSTVRIHHSPHVNALGARAVTVGERIHFALGEYQPMTETGAVLLCRELGHVVQQRQLTAARRFAGVPIVREPWLEAEASRRGLDLIAQRRPSQGRAASTIQCDPLTIGLIVGGVALGVIGLAALGTYLYRCWRGGQNEERRPLLEEVRVDRTDPFELAWSVTQDADVGTQPPLGDVLIISEAGREQERTGRLLKVYTSIMRTYYAGEFWFRKNALTLDGTWRAWNWIDEDFPTGDQFDTIIARSMICACEDDHFENGRGPFGGDAVQTCGGIGTDARVTVMARVLGRLKPGGRAIFTVSRQGGGVPAKVRSEARAKSRVYWQPVLQRLPDSCEVDELTIPREGLGTEPVGDYFGFIVRRTR